MSHSENSEEDEWEYEYEPDEYEDVYVTVTLPPKTQATDPNKSIFSMYIPPQLKAPKPRVPQRRRRRRNPETGELMPLPPLPDTPSRNEAEDEGEAEDGDEGEEEGAAAGQPKNIREMIERLDQSEYDVGGIEDKTNVDGVQIVDLDEKEVLLSYQGTVYSCHWATTLGTDMFFAKRKEENAEIIRDDPIPLREFDEWNLLGLSSVRLVAKEAKLIHKQARPELKPGETGQSAFLQRLVEVQKRKGELTGDAAGEEETAALRTLFLGPPAPKQHSRKRKSKHSTGGDPMEDIMGPAGTGAGESLEDAIEIEDET